ncbi:hypothetical protein [Planctomycetes bacterium CA13]|uniref:hypothetical protein n=1 Tax=Novipirellula herctigrandis TaxID=2527986 RepID=UPI0011B792C9
MDRKSGISRRGRPARDPKLIRRNRVVTLLTDAELEKLTGVADREEKSVSALVHEVVSKFLKRLK